QMPDKRDLVIYELHVRDFVQSRSIKEVQSKLDYLQKLGVNAVELMPINEFEGNSSWGYNPSFYFAADKMYGTDYDYKAFVNECHQRGMAVILDMVLNHAYGQCPFVQMYFANGKPAGNNPWFNTTSPNPVYSWGYDFNHESGATKKLVNQVVRHWLDEYHFDGFRFDFTKGFTNTPGEGHGYDLPRINILKRIHDEMQEIKPGSLMVCEHLADNSEEKILANHGILLWGNMNHNYLEASMGYLPGSDLSWGSYQARGWSQPHLIAYMESHDEERMMFKNLSFGNQSTDGAYSSKHVPTALDRSALAASFFFTIPGPKMLWQFGELGYDVSINQIQKGGEVCECHRIAEKPIFWNYYDQGDRRGLYLAYARLIELKTKYPVFRTADFTLQVGNSAVKTITLRSPGHDVVVVGNFGMTATTYELNFTQDGTWQRYLSPEPLVVNNKKATLNLAPGEYRIYSTVTLQTEASRGRHYPHRARGRHGLSHLPQSGP
ncbi:MAG: alpha-amylase, partial [Cytophagales bacterium]|nr:alpha-amylase [Cytophagales bacterium]